MKYGDMGIGNVGRSQMTGGMERTRGANGANGTTNGGGSSSPTGDTRGVAEERMQLGFGGGAEGAKKGELDGTEMEIKGEKYTLVSEKKGADEAGSGAPTDQAGGGEGDMTGAPTGGASSEGAGNIEDTDEAGGGEETGAGGGEGGNGKNGAPGIAED